jgi:hypothetical protein
MDHGSPCLSDHFQTRTRFRGIAPGGAFISGPQTNGVVERLFRLLQEQVIYGRISQNLEAVPRVVSGVVATCNSNWRLDKLGFLSPSAYRLTYLQKRAA